MQRASGEQVPCLSAAESNGLLLDHSHNIELAHTGSIQARDEISDMSPCSSHRPDHYHLVLSSDSTGTNNIDDNAVSQPLDSSKPTPRVLSFSWSSFLTDSVYILSTIPFIVLACLLARANVKPVHQASDQNFDNGIRVAATALPIIFAVVFGRLATQVARRKLEMGASLSSIEQWLGSRTVFSAFLTQVRLGSLNTVGVSMTIIWALSPLGAQSILRALETAQKDTQTHSELVYFDTNSPPFFTESTFWGNTGDVDLTRSMYAAALFSADNTKASSQDSWGNVKIPYLSSYASNHSNYAWVKVPNNDSLVYSSLIGLPAASIMTGPHLRYTFNMESSYIELQCDSVVRSYLTNSEYASFYTTFDNTSLLTPPSRSDFPRVQNGTRQGCSDNGYGPWFLASDTFVDPLWLKRKSKWTWSYFPSRLTEGRESIADNYSPNAFANETNILTSQARLLFKTISPLTPGDRSPYTTQFSTTCWVSQLYIESKVECGQIESRASECSVVAQRPSQQPRASTNITHLSYPWVFSTLSRNLPTASGLQFSAGPPDASLLYLRNTSLSFMLDGTRDTNLNLENSKPDDFSYRLGQLINSYLIANQAFESIASGTMPPDHLGNITANASIHTFEAVYSISIPWLTVFFITTLVMFVGSLAGAVFCHMSKTPEILGYASSAIRDSKYVNLAPGFGGLGGLEMTKAFDGIEFRYGVVGKLDSGQQVLGVSWKVNARPVKRGVPYV